MAASYIIDCQIQRIAMKWTVFPLFFATALTAEILSQQDCFVKSGEAKLFCHVMGSGEPVIVLHGGPRLSFDYLLPQMGQFAKGRRLIFYDQRGSGKSEGEGRWFRTYQPTRR